MSALTAPAVSIILPTYNRARFLPQAIQSIRAQQWTDWELIIVDDGSTDETPELIPRLTADIEQPVRYIHQDNQGAYAARNTGLDHARGKYIAFFDSDDIWLPHHLKDCVNGLNANSDVDWVFAACEIRDHQTGCVIAPNTFFVGNRPRRFLRLRTRQAEDLRIIVDRDALRQMILQGYCCGLQNSVIRAAAIQDLRFTVRWRHECEDRLVALRAMARGLVFAYFDRVHVIYHVHDANSSAPGSAGDMGKTLDILTNLVAGHEQLKRELKLSLSERMALNACMARELFWRIGYSLLWQHGRKHEALAYYRRALWLCPWKSSYWKTYLISVVKARLAPTRRVPTHPPA